MISLGIFLEEFTNEKRKRSIIKNFVIIGFLTYLFSQNEVAFKLPINSIALVLLLLTFISSYTTTFNFNKASNVKKYLSLPIKDMDYVFSLYITLIILTFVDKVLFIVAVALIITNLNISIIIISILSIALMVAVSINILVSLSKNNLILKVINIISVIIPIALCFVNINQIQMFIGFGVILLINLFLLTTAKLSNLVFHPKSKANTKTFKNYYINVLKNDTILIVNSLFLVGLAFIYYLYLFKNESIFLKAFPIAMVASNKIVSTLISQDRDTLKKVNSLPSNNIYKHYFSFNLMFMYAIYFILSISAIFVFKFNLIIVGLIFILCPIIIAIVNTYLEKHYPILLWSDLNQLWKSPRNYIVLVATYIVVLSVMLINFI